MSEINTFSALYENMQSVLEEPANYEEKITRFSAGGLGACGYSDDITAGELARCWRHEEYCIKCLHCKEDAYITFWAGSVNGGGYWEIKAYCPRCGKEHRYESYTASTTHHVHWTTMRNILQEERKTIKDKANRDEGQLNEKATQSDTFLQDSLQKTTALENKEKQTKFAPLMVEKPLRSD